MLNLKEVSTREEWEGFIKNAGFQPLFFQGWEWGQLERVRGKDVYNLGIYSQEQQDVSSILIGIALAVFVKARRGNFLHIRGGPLMNWSDEATTKEVTKLFINFSKELNCDFLRISPNIYKTEANKVDWLLNEGFEYCQMHDVDAEITWILDLTQDEETILKNMRDSTRYLIKRAQKMPDLEILQSTEEKDLKHFWEIYQDTVRRQKWHAYSYDYIKEEFLEYVKNNKALLFLAKYQGKYIASSIFLYEFNQVYYHHSGSLSEFKKIPAMYLLHWESILEAKKRGCNKYNFFGIAGDQDPKHPWAGLTLFKKGFGGSQQEMVHALDYPLTTRYWVTHYYEKIEKKLRGYK